MWKTLRKTCLFGLVLLGFVFVSLVNSKSVNAVSVSQALYGVVNRSLNGGAWSNANTIATPTYYPARVVNLSSEINTYQARVISVSGRFPQGGSGASLTARLTGELIYSGNAAAFSNISCYGMTGAIRPEQGSVSGVSDSLTCEPSNNGRVLNFAISSSVNLASTADISTFTYSISNYTNNIISCSNNVGALVIPCISGDYYYLDNINITYDIALDPLVGLTQTIVNQNTQIINSLDETNDWLKDTTPPNVDSSGLAQSAGWLPAGPVDSILTIPITLLTGIVNVFTNPSACQAVQLPLPFVNTNIELPCVGPILNQIGITPLWNFVGAIIGFFLIWNTYKWLYEFVDKTLTFRENNSSIWGGL